MCGIPHIMGFEGKYGLSVVTSGGGDEPPVRAYMSRFLMATGIVSAGEVRATMGLVRGDDMPADIATRAESLGRKLVNAWRNQAEPDPAVKRDMDEFRERMRQLMLWKKDEWPWEFRYRVENRGLEQG
ncbi:MAG: hypothetical protein ACLFOY_13865 [Desulfatibacillaceae bacterium]